MPLFRVCKTQLNGVLPARQHQSDAGMDLFASEQKFIGPHETVDVSLGIIIEIPPGFAGLILPRSGLAMRKSITVANAPGLIDPGYRGEAKVLLHNLNAYNGFSVFAGDRIAQLMIVAANAFEPIEVTEDKLTNSDRGAEGFGSTGVTA